MNTLIILEEADNELSKAVVWYEERSNGLGFRFLEVIKQKLETVLEYPERNTKRKGNFREAIVKIFPYVIIYTFYKKERIVSVSAIFHTSRNPKRKYKKRLRSKS